MSYLIQDLHEHVACLLIVNQQAKGELYFCQGLRGKPQSRDVPAIPVVVKKDNELSLLRLFLLRGLLYSSLTKACLFAGIVPIFSSILSGVSFQLENRKRTDNTLAYAEGVKICP